MECGLILVKLRGFFAKTPRVDRYHGILTWIRSNLGPWIEIQRQPWVERLGRRRRVRPAAAHCGGLAGVAKNGGPGLGYERGLAGERKRGAANVLAASAWGVDAAEGALDSGVARRGDGERPGTRGSERERGK